MSDVKVRSVSVYVRKGEHDGQRTLAVRLEDGIDPLEFLRLGFAIDGNQAVTIVDSSEEGNWTERLNAIQRIVVDYLGTIGYEPQFS